MSIIQYGREEIVRSSIQPVTRCVYNLILKLRSQPVLLDTNVREKEMDRDLTSGLGSIRTALAGPITDASTAVSRRQNRTKTFCQTPDLLRSQIQVSPDKNPNFEKVKLEPDKPSGKPSPYRSWWRMTSQRTVVVLATARSS